MNSRFSAVLFSLLLIVSVSACSSDGDGGDPGGNTGADVGSDLRSIDDSSLFDVPESDNGDDVTISGEICDNFADDDEDTLIDCDDPDCTDFAGCDEPTDTETECDDEIDNDDDGRADCNDPDCASAPNCDATASDEICDNGEDDDLDGLIDCYDGDCGRDPACQATSAEDCSNGVDDDGDGLIDCDDDADCESYCTGGTGGDLDLIMCLLACLMDPEGAECATCLAGFGGGGAGETNCTNGIDDDSNGMTDCDDFNCMLSDPSCQ